MGAGALKHKAGAVLCRGKSCRGKSFRSRCDAKYETVDVSKHALSKTLRGYTPSRTYARVPRAHSEASLSLLRLYPPLIIIIATKAAFTSPGRRSGRQHGS
eukprot:COSAG06_NODE_2480_length_6788_cov_3.392084_9_plen_101_part_00